MAVILVFLLAVLGYVLYVVLAFDRLEDDLPLETEGKAERVLSEGEPLRILSYNVGFGAYSDDYSFFMDGGTESRARSEEAVYENIGGAMQAARDAEPDLILLQEVDADGDRSWHIDERELVKDAFPEKEAVFAQNYDSPYLLYPFREPHGANRAGLMTLSDFPIASAKRRSLPIEGGFMKFVDLDRCYAVHRIPMESGRELVLYNFHLSAYTSDGAIAEEQMKMLFADMKAETEKGNAVIAGGDFNKDILGNSAEVFGVSGEAYTWAQPVPKELIPEGLRIVVPFDEADPKASCRNADRPYGKDSFLVTVDGFIVSDDVKAEKSRVLPYGYRMGAPKYWARV